MAAAPCRLVLASRCCHCVQTLAWAIESWPSLLLLYRIATGQCLRATLMTVSNCMSSCVASARAWQNFMASLPGFK